MEPMDAGFAAALAVADNMNLDLASAGLDEGGRRRSTRRRRAASDASDGGGVPVPKRPRGASVSDVGGTGMSLSTTPVHLPTAVVWADDPSLPADTRIDHFKQHIVTLGNENARLRALVSSLTSDGISLASLLSSTVAGPIPTALAPGSSARGDATSRSALAAALQRATAAEAGGMRDSNHRLVAPNTLEERREASARSGRTRTERGPRGKAAVTPGLDLPHGMAPLDFTVVPEGLAAVVLPPTLKPGRPAHAEITGSNTVVRCGRRVTNRYGYHGVSMDRRTGVFQGFIGLPGDHPAFPAAKGRPVRCGSARTPLLAALKREVRAVHVFRMTPQDHPSFLWNFAESSRGWIDSAGKAFTGPDPELLPPTFNDSENVPEALAAPLAPPLDTPSPTTIPRIPRSSGKAKSAAPEDVAAFFEGAAAPSSGAQAPEDDDEDLGDFDLGDLDELHGEDDLGDLTAVAEAAAADFVAEYRAGQAGEAGYGFDRVAAAGMEEVVTHRAAQEAEGAQQGEDWVAVAAEAGAPSRPAAPRGKRKYTRRAVGHLRGGPAMAGPIGAGLPEGVNPGSEDPKWWRPGCRTPTGYYGVRHTQAGATPYRSRIKIKGLPLLEHTETTAFRAALAREISALEPSMQRGTCRTRKFKWNFAHKAWVDFTSRADQWRWVGPLPGDVPATATEDMIDLFWTEARATEARSTRPWTSLGVAAWPSAVGGRRRTPAAAPTAAPAEGGEDGDPSSTAPPGASAAPTAVALPPLAEDAPMPPAASTVDSQATGRPRGASIDVDVQEALLAVQELEAAAAKEASGQ